MFDFSDELRLIREFERNVFPGDMPIKKIVWQIRAGAGFRPDAGLGFGSHGLRCGIGWRD